MNQPSQVEPQPANGRLLHGPLQLGMAEMPCWKCKKNTKVVAIIAADVEVFENRESLGSDEEESYVHSIGEVEMPAALAHVLGVLAPNYRPIYSHTMDETTWANGCEHCGALQGAFYQHLEPDSPFFGRPEYFTGTRIELLPHSVALVDGNVSSKNLED